MKHPSVLSVGALAAGIATAFLAGCHPPAADRATRTVRIATGSPDGFYHAFGEALAHVYNRDIPGVAASAEPIAGSVLKVEELDKGAIELAFVGADIAYTAYARDMLRGDHSYPRLRGIAVVYSSALHVVVRADSRFHALSDLRDARIGFGGAVTDFFPTLSFDDPIVVASALVAGNLHVTRFALDDLAEVLESRQVAGALVLAGYPLGVLKELSSRVPVRLLEVGPEVATRVRAQYPFLKPWLIPANTYVGQREPVRTVAVDNLLVCRNDLDEDLVYLLTKALFESLPRLAEDHEMGRQVNADWASATPVPLHPGAARYYRERQLLQ
jgi:uncharacterized protein